MELELTIYTDRTLKEIEKKYATSDFKLSTGVAEDLLDLINIDMFNGELEENQQLGELLKVVVKGKNAFKDILKNVFDGLTDDECSRTDLKEFVRVVYNIITYTIGNLFSIADEKN